MRFFKLMCAIALLTGTVTHADAKQRYTNQVYMFGFSASFNDSIVYFTDVQLVDSAWIDNKRHFLVSRDQYAYQLRDHMTYRLNMPHRTCFVMFADNRTKAEKLFVKMKKLYAEKAKGRFDIHYLNINEFSFKPVEASLDENAKEKKPKKPKKIKRGGPKD